MCTKVGQAFACPTLFSIGHSPHFVHSVFESLEVGASIEDIVEQYDVTPEQIQAVLEFAARSLAAPPFPGVGSLDAHPV